MGRIIAEQRVIRAVDDERIAVGGVHQAVVELPAERPGVPRDLQLDAAPARVADILEETHIGQCAAGGLEQDVVPVDALVGVDLPGEAPGEAATHTDFAAARHHVLQRRIGQEGVGQVARRVFVGTGQLHRRGRAAGLGQVAVHDQPVVPAPCEAQCRIDATIAVIAVEFRREAAAIAEGNARVVVARRSGQRQAPRDVERIGGIQAPGSDADWRRRCGSRRRRYRCAWCRDPR